MSYFIDVSVTFVISGDLKFLEIKYDAEHQRGLHFTVICKVKD